VSSTVTIDVKRSDVFNSFFYFLNRFFIVKNVGTGVTQNGVLMTFFNYFASFVRYLEQAGNATW